MLKRRLGLLLVSATVVLWTAATAGWPGPRWRVWERAFEDQLQLLRGQRRPPAELLVVPVDDATLQQGAWFEQNRRIPAWARGVSTLPWPRAAYGRLAETLLQAGAEAVAINVVFDGPSSNGPADDAAMAAILARHPGRIALAAEMLEAGDARGAGSLTLVRPEPFMPALAAGTGTAEAALGLANTPLRAAGDPLPHPQAYGGGLLAAEGVEALPSLPLTLLRLAGRTSRQDDAHSGLNVYGPEGSFARLPAWEVLDPERWRDHERRSSLKGALVLVGPVVAQSDDGYPTAFGSLSGLELLATATANSLHGDGLRPWPVSPARRAAMGALPVLLVGLLALARPGLAWRLGLVGAALGLQLALGLLVLQLQHRWLPLLAPLGGLLALALVHGGEAYLWEERERRRLRRTFERYVAPGVVAEILADPAAAQGILRGRVLEVTVLFCDLKGFTALTRQRSQVGASELHVRQLNDYLGAMVEVITAEGGTVDKFIGDAVMAVFGSPVGRGPRQEAQAALRCALAMRRALDDLNTEWRRSGITPLDNGIGLASGPVVVGQIGSPQRMEFTVIGDTVNLASRLEALTRRLGCAVLFDRATAERLAADAEAVEAEGGQAEGGEALALGLEPIRGFGEVEVFAPRALQPSR